MKKFIILIVFAALIIFLVFRDTGYNPYSGTYQYIKNTNLILRLSKDNSYMLYYAVGKRSEFIKGKYEVEENNITLTPDKDNTDIFINKTLHGKVEGSRIKVVELSGDFIKH